MTGEFPRINLPAVDLNLRRDGDVVKVFDRLRHKYVALTPEEYVRQHFVAYLIDQLHYPASLMANETSIDLNGTRRRCDTVVFESDGTPLMIVEYKAPGVTVTQETFDQIARYNICLRAKYLVVSNGVHHYCCVMDYANNSYNFIPSIPDYLMMKSHHSDN